MSARAQTSAGASPSVLLVDDEPANLQLLYESLHGSGYRLLVARDGQQALDIAERMRPDVVLLDIMMPGMDGFEVCERIKAKQETSKIAVIFLSALVTPEDKAHGLRLGAVDYISKPFAPDELMARVETHCMMVRLGRELEQRNRELELSRDRVLRAMNEGVVGLDASGRVAYINPAAERILEAEATSMHGRDVGSLEPGALREAVETVLGGGEQVEIPDLNLPRSNGEPLPAELCVVPIRDASGGDGAVVVLRDLTMRRRAEARLALANRELRASNRELQDAQLRLIQAAKLESVGRLAAGVAHEVKNPLAIIQLGLDFLEETLELEPTAAEIFVDMQVALSRADTVVRGLLDFSRERELRLTAASINAIIQAALKLVRHELGQRNIQAVATLEESLPETLLDADKLQQVFLNLFMNAMHAMGRDGVLSVTSELIQVDAEALIGRLRDLDIAPGQQAIRVVIRDTGAGIAERDLARLFDPFFTTKRQGEGTGLGLSVTHNIVNLHRAGIDIGNHPDGGARVTLLFRIQDQSEDKPQ